MGSRGGVENYSPEYHLEAFRAAPGVYIHQSIIAGAIGCDLQKPSDAVRYRQFIGNLRSQLQLDESILTIWGSGGLVLVKSGQPGDMIEPTGFRADPLWFSKTGLYEPVLRQAMKGVRRVRVTNETTAVSLVSVNEYKLFLLLASTIDRKGTNPWVSTGNLSGSFHMSEDAVYQLLDSLRQSMGGIGDMPLRVASMVRAGYRLELLP